jgi:hypothetical protein
MHTHAHAGFLFLPAISNHYQPNKMKQLLLLLCVGIRCAHFL